MSYFLMFWFFFSNWKQLLWGFKQILFLLISYENVISVIINTRSKIVIFIEKRIREIPGYLKKSRETGFLKWREFPGTGNWTLWIQIMAQQIIRVFQFQGAETSLFTKLSVFWNITELKILLSWILGAQLWKSRYEKYWVQ